MKILAISHEYPPIGGGGANACMFLTREFVKLGHSVQLVTCNFQNMIQDEVVDNVRIHRINAKRANKDHCGFSEMLDFVRKALPYASKLCKNSDFDVCLVFFGIPSGPIGYWLKKRYRLPYIIRFGGGDIPGFQERFTSVYKLLGPAIKVIWKNADARIANSQGLKTMALDFCNKYDFDVICNGVDTDYFCTTNRDVCEVVKILFVSRLIERKGLQFIFPKIAEIVERTEKPVKFVIVGDGPYREKLERIASDSGVEQYISFVGHKEKSEIVAYYQDADVFILPSAKEGMPNVVLEAMASGLPIVMTDCQGAKELIDGNGFIASIDDFADKIVELIDDDSMREQMSIASRRRAEKYFSWSEKAREYERTLQWVLDRT